MDYKLEKEKKQLEKEKEQLEKEYEEAYKIHIDEGGCRDQELMIWVQQHLMVEDKKLVCDSCHIHLNKDVDVMCWNRKNRSSMSWGGEKKTLCNRCYFGDDYKD